jgi:hypothetical protein
MEAADTSEKNGTQRDTTAEDSGSTTNSDSEPEYEVELIKKRRVKKGVTEYLVKWKGYNNRHNTWQAGGTLENSKELIADFEQAHTALALISDAGPVRHLLQPEEEVERQAAIIFGPDNMHEPAVSIIWGHFFVYIDIIL